MKFSMRTSVVTRLSVQMGMLVLAAFAVLITTVIVIVRHNEVQNVYEQTRTLAKAETNEVRNYLQQASEVARAMASCAESIVGASPDDRRIINATMKNALDKNPGLLSIWCAFEPDVFYAPDSQYVNTPYGNDKGRFTTGMNKARGTISFDVTDEEGLVPGDGDWYLVPRDAGRELVVEPYAYAYYPDTPEFFETSCAVPIMHNGKVIGVAGSDIALKGLADSVNKIKPFGTGYITIISNGGIYATNPDEGQMGKSVGDSPEMQKVKQAIAEGKTLEFNRYDAAIKGEARMVLVPIQIGQAKEQWGVLVAIPMKQALAPVTRLTWICASVSIVAMLLLLACIILISRQMLRPIQRLRDVATCLSEGDINKASDLMKKAS